MINEPSTMISALHDAGCDREQIDCFLSVSESPQQIRLLESFRSQILSRIHRDERRIETLDFLIYQLSEALRKDA